MLAFIPSPTHGIVHIGPLQLHAYGLMLAIGVLVAAKIADVRWQRTGHDPEGHRRDRRAGRDRRRRSAPASTTCSPDTSWSEGGIIGAFEIWKGGLSIWGAVAGGLIAVVIIARRRHLDTLALLDAIAPGVVVAQAIGRWGNYFNQELFGRPSKLPWALEIDLAHRPVRATTQFATFQPTFLYESIWCLLVFGTIVWIERHSRSAQGPGVRAVRRDVHASGASSSSGCASTPRSRIFGIRFNLLLSAVLCVIGTVWFVRLGRRSEPSAIGPSRDPVTPRPRSGILRIATGRRRFRNVHGERAEGVAVTTTTPPTTTVAARAVDAIEGLRRQATPRCARSTASTSTFERGAYTAIMGPSGSGKSTLLHCIAGLDTLTSGQVFLGDIELSALSDKELTQVRRDRIGFVFQAYNLIPTLTAMENITLPIALAGPQARPGVARPHRRHRRVCAIRLSTGRRSCPAVSSSASRSPARSRAGPRSSSPTSPPATSTRARAPRSSGSCSRRSQEFGQTIVMVTHDPIAASYASRVVFLADGTDRRRDPRPDRRRDPRQDAQARAASSAHVEGHAQGARRAQAALRADRARGDPRRRVHVGHARAHRDDPEDVRRPVRRTSTRAPTRSVRGHEGAHSDFGAGPARRTSPASLVDGRRADAERRGRASATCRSPTRRSSTRNGKAASAGTGAPTFGFGWDPNPKLNQFHIVAGRPPAADRRRDRHRQAAPPTRATSRSATRSTVLTAKAPQQVHRSSASRSSAPPTASRARRSCSSRCPRRSASRTRSASSTQISVVAKPGVSQDAGRRRHPGDARRARPDRKYRGHHRQGAHQGEPGRDPQGARLPQHRARWSSRSSRSIVGAFIIYNTFSIVVAQRMREMALLRAIGASRGRCSRRCIGESRRRRRPRVARSASSAASVCRSGSKALMNAVGFEIPGSGVVLRPNAVIVGLLVGTIVTVVSAVVPARQAARVPPIAAMRDVALERPINAAAPARHRRRASSRSASSRCSSGCSAAAASGFVGLGALLMFVGVFVLGAAVRPAGELVIGVPLTRLKGIDRQPRPRERGAEPAAHRDDRRGA